MQLGTTSFAFRYQFLDPAQAPSIREMIKQTADAGIDLLQICENTRPLDVPLETWADIAKAGEEYGVELHVGMKTTSADIFRAYHQRATILGSRDLRVVLEDAQGVPATEAGAKSFIEDILPLLEETDSRIAIENYFGIPCRALAEWCKPYPKSRVGFCVDSANSLRKFERLDEVLELLSERAFCWHVKDWRMQGSDVGFSVSGSYLGTGDLPLDTLVRHILAQSPNPKVYLENWPPSSGDRATDIATDQRFLEEAITAWWAAVERAREQGTGLR